MPLILAAIIVAKNPAQYGFDIVAHDPIAYDKVTVPRAIDLRRVAEWTGTSIDEIQALNPELRRWTTPVKYPEYEVKVPVGHGRQAPGAARRRVAGRSDRAEVVHGQARRDAGDDRAQAAGQPRRPGGGEQPRRSSRASAAGQELIIPRAPATLLAARTERAAPAAVASRALSGSRRRVVGAPSSRPQTPDRLPRQARRHARRRSRGCSTRRSTRLKSLNKLRGNAHRRRRPAEDRPIDSTVAASACESARTSA